MPINLTNLELFADCTKKDLRLVDELSTRLRFGAGSMITNRAESGRQVILICSGTVVVGREGENVATASAGEVVAMAGSGIDSGPISLHALTECDVMVMTRGEFRGLELDVPHTAARIRAAAERATNFATTSNRVTRPQPALAG